MWRSRYAGACSVRKGGGRPRWRARMTFLIHAVRGCFGTRAVNCGDVVVAVERGRNKALCQVIWTADPASPLRGQLTVQCVEEGKTPWEEELRQMEEQYQPVILDGSLGNRTHGSIRPDANRRRWPRFYVEGQAEVIDGVQRVEGEVQQISEFGARITGCGCIEPRHRFPPADAECVRRECRAESAGEVSRREPRHGRGISGNTTG